MEGVRATYINGRMANAYCEIKITDFLTWVGGGGGGGGGGGWGDCRNHLMYLAARVRPQNS